MAAQVLRRHFISRTLFAFNFAGISAPTQATSMLALIGSPSQLQFGESLDEA